MTTEAMRSSAEATLRRAAAFLRAMKADSSEHAGVDPRQALPPLAYLDVLGRGSSSRAHGELGSDALAERIEKTMWGSPAGKKRLAPRLVKLIPTHKTYVEPFAGSGAVFFAKQPASKEVLADADPEIAFAYQALSKLSSRELAVLKKKDWTGSRKRYRALQKAEPNGKLEKLYKFLYLSHFSYGNLRGRGFNPAREGSPGNTFKRIEKYHHRLRKVIVRSAHYADVVKEFDGKDTFFFLDPPYRGTNVWVGEEKFDEQEFRKILDGIKGKFLVTYGTRGELDTSGFQVRKIRTRRTIHSQHGDGGSILTQLLISNYTMSQKSLEPFELDEVAMAVDLPLGTAADIDLFGALASALAKRTDASEIHTLVKQIDQLDDATGDGAAVLAEELLSIGQGLIPEISTALPELADAIRAARPVIEVVAKIDATERSARVAESEELLEKARLIPFQQWGGSAKYARWLADRLPPHTRYVEPFCGAAAVFYAKSRAEHEVLADADPSVVAAHRFLKGLDDSALAALRKFEWKVSRAGFKKVRACEPSSEPERFWKLAYGRLCSYGANPKAGFSTIHDGRSYDVDELWKFHERLKGVKIVHQDWKKTLADHDSAETLFFIDPPYVDEWQIGDGVAAEEIAKAVRRLKGKYIIAYTDSRKARQAFADVGHTSGMRIPEGRAGGHWLKRSRLFVASIPLRKAETLENSGKVSVPLAVALAKRIPLLKTGEERYVLGIVLEPETVDAQNDIYSAETVREAAHKFMAEYRHVGLMHRGLIDDRVKILESYLAPSSFEIDGVKVKQGTWLLAVRVEDDALWTQVKNGELTGLSMGGSALSAPESDRDSRSTA